MIIKGELLDSRTSFPLSTPSKPNPINQPPMPLKHRRYDQHPGSPIELCTEILGGKWKGPILFSLFQGRKRFRELRRLFPGVTQRVLTRQLRQLEEHGIVTREVHAEVPPRVEYSLSDLGQSLHPIVEVMRTWGTTYLQRTCRLRSPFTENRCESETIASPAEANTL